MARNGKQPSPAKVKNIVLNIMLEMGVFNAIQRFNKTALTVLNYHRIDDASRPDFDTFSPNVTATPAEFARHMDYLGRHFNVISCDDLSAWLRHEKELPPFPALITFDDGYYDNYANAYPILKARDLPAVIFLTTGLIGKDQPVYWDYVAYCFHHTRKKSAILPHSGEVSWLDSRERRRVMKSWIEILKRLSDPEKQRAVDNLAGTLDVTVPEGAFSKLYLTWDQVREMSENGIEMGSHTVGHPILTRIPLSQVENELSASRERIESEIGKPVLGFAYPNGSHADYSPDVVNLVRQTGYQLAFTLTGGASPCSQVRANPFTISRIYLDSSDVFPRFVAKISSGRPLFV